MHNQPIIIDVRDKEQFEQENIPGSRSMPLEELEQRSNELDKKEQIRVVCNRGGQRSQKALQLLKEKGFENAELVEGGLARWKEEN